MAPEQVKKMTKTNAKMLEAFEGFHEHLKANEVDLQKTPVTLGPMLQMDPEKERFFGDFPSKWANQLITRSHREPFVVPEKV